MIQKCFKKTSEMIKKSSKNYQNIIKRSSISHSNIPLLHLEAGDITEGGTYDDQIRHCISKLSHLYCTSTLKGTETLFNFSRIGSR